jgi:hypothetical protein
MDHHREQRTGLASTQNTINPAFALHIVEKECLTFKSLVVD